MDIQIEVENLQKAFVNCASVVKTNSPIEILQNVKIEAGDACWLYGTNTETTIANRLSATVNKPGKALVNADRLGKILREVRGPMQIFADGTELVLKSSSAQWRLPTANASEFPTQKLLEGSEIVLDSATLKAAIHKTVFACDDDNARYALGGIRFESEGNAWFVIGSDGRRLSRFRFELSPCPEISSELIVPAVPARIIDKILDEESCVVDFSANLFQVTCGDVLLLTRLVEGRFPAWRQILRSTAEMKRAALAAGSLLQGVKQASIVADVDTRGVEFTFRDGMIDITSKAAERGQASISVPAEYSGETTAIKLDHKYLMDFLKTCEPEDVVHVYFAQPRDSVILDDQQGSLYLVMPMANL